jgi:hypothetical protein
MDERDVAARTSEALHALGHERMPHGQDLAMGQFVAGIERPVDQSDIRFEDPLCIEIPPFLMSRGLGRIRANPRGDQFEEP